MEHEYFNILFNKIAVTPQQCVILSLSTLPLRPSSSLSFCSLILSFSQAEHTRRHLSSTYNESRLRAFKKLTEPFALNISYSSSLSHHRSRWARHPLPRSRSLAASVSPANPLLYLSLTLSFPLSSRWANLMSVFISLTARHFSLLLQADTWPEW